MPDIISITAAFMGITKEQLIVNIIEWAVVIILISLLIREFRTWYWKVNERIDNQEKIMEQLNAMKEMQEYQRNFLKYIYKEHQETNNILKEIAKSQEIKLESKDKIQ